MRLVNKVEGAMISCDWLWRAHMVGWWTKYARAAFSLLIDLWFTACAHQPYICS